MPNNGSPYAVKVGARLAAARDAAGLKGVDLARRLGISPQQLGHYEKGRHVFPPALAPKLFLVLRVNSDYLYLGDLSRLPKDMFDKVNAHPALSEEA